VGTIQKKTLIPMHELSLCQGIIEVLEAEARRQHFQKVRVVHLEIGALSGVDEEALRFGFEVVSRGTLAENAALAIEKTPGTAWCFDCNRTIGIAEYYDPCPECQGHKLRVEGGEQMRVKEIEVF
jgi:hydrogenase nickel incorporation protein HypA/HybF